MSCKPLTQKPRQPKLRSSCDGCGAAKLKCDRGQPECGRCVSFGMPCVYGESRKFGRPPRQPVPKRTTGISTPSSSGRSSEQPEDSSATAAAVLAVDRDQRGPTGAVSHNSDDGMDGLTYP